MADLLFYLFVLLVVAALLLATVFFLRGYLTGTSPTTALFGARPEKRLEVVDQASVDGRRRLLLIRRDDVEHLIMTGGPVDVVIETGIGAPRQRAADVAPAVYTRQPRAFGQASGNQASANQASGNLAPAPQGATGGDRATG